MVCRCVAAGCSQTNKDGVSLFKFPRAKDKWAPTNSSQLCSRHFKGCCFEPDSKLSEAMGLGKRKACLKPNPIPTIFEKPASLKRTAPALESHVPKRRRIAYVKHERSRVSSFVV